MYFIHISYLFIVWPPCTVICEGRDLCQLFSLQYLSRYNRTWRVGSIQSTFAYWMDEWLTLLFWCAWFVFFPASWYLLWFIPSLLSYSRTPLCIISGSLLLLLQQSDTSPGFLDSESNSVPSFLPLMIICRAPDTKQDPMGLLGTKTSLCSPFLDYRK